MTVSLGGRSYSRHFVIPASSLKHVIQYESRMAWLKNVILDLLVMLCILAATVFGQTWAMWVVVVYTPLMLVLKVAAFFMPDMGGRVQRDEVPDLFYHLLYALDAGLLLLYGWWWTGAGWLLIWALSAIRALRRRRPRGA